MDFITQHAKDTTYLQNLLKDAKEVVIPEKNPLTGDDIWNISEALLLHSDLTVTLDGAHLRLQDGVYANIFATENPHGTGACEELNNIRIIGKNGATLDGGLHNGLTERTANTEGRPSVLYNTLVYMRNVTDFSVENIRIIHPRYWGMTFYFCEDGVIRNIEFEADNTAPNQDGIDLRLGCHDIRIEHITGSTGDDTVALTGLMGYSESAKQIPGKSPDIHHVLIRDICTYVTGGHGIVRLLNHDGVCLHHVEISGVYDRAVDIPDAVRNQAAIRIGDKNYSHIRPATDDETHHIHVEHVKTNARFCAVWRHGNPGTLTCEDIVNTAENGVLIKDV